MKTPNIEILHVSKAYRNGTQALADVSFSVGSGVFGLLGHNGAGKTTLLQALATVLRPTAGNLARLEFLPVSYTHLRAHEK